MTTTIGVATLRDESPAARSGNRLIITGTVGAIVTATDATNVVKAAIQQLTGYIENVDETAVGVTSTIDSSIDGYYQVVSVTEAAVGTGANHARVTVELLRWGSSYTGVQHETGGTIVTRTNPAGATAAPLWCIPQAATTFDPPNTWKNLALASRSAEDGVLHAVPVDTATGAVSGRFTAAPSVVRVGAARIEHKYASTYYTMVGRHAPLTPTSWRLANGLMRITPSATANYLLDVSVWNGTSWSTAAAYWFYTSNKIVPTANASATNLEIVSARILRNSPEVSIIRLAVRYTSATVGTTFATRQAMLSQLQRRTQVVDVALRRGDRVVAVTITNRPTSTSYLQMELNGAAAGTAITGGVVQTAADASGNKPVIMTANTIDVAPTTMSLSTGPTGSTTAVEFGIGYVVPAAAATPDGAADLVQQYIGCVAEKQSVVLA